MPNHFPAIRIELEGVRYQVLHALNTHNTEIEAVVKKELAKAIDTFDYAAVVKASVKEAVDGAVKDAVKSFFYHGGGRATIESAVKESLTSILNKEGKDYW